VSTEDLTAWPHRLLLRNRKDEIVGETLVDRDVLPWATTYRWHKNLGGYAARSIKGTDGKWKIIYLHREIMGLGPTGVCGPQIDHRNRDKLDNRRSNLRLATIALNQQNQTKRPGLSSRYLGVRRTHRVKRPWQVRVSVDGRTYYGGTFADEDEAGRVAAELRARVQPYSTD
jgi:hypothetical protein